MTIEGGCITHANLAMALRSVSRPLSLLQPLVGRACLLSTATSSQAAAASASPEATSSTNQEQLVSAASTAFSGWVHRGTKEHQRTAKKPSGWWTRKGPDGEPVAIPGWEKMYWGFGLTGVALLVLPRMYVHYRSTKSKEEQEKEDKEKQRMQQERELRRAAIIPMMATGKSFIDEEEAQLFDGMSPQDINALAKTKLGGVGLMDDPFDGMSPEEIDALFPSN